MNEYQKEQLETLLQLRGVIKTLSPEDIEHFRRITSEYMDFRTKGEQSDGTRLAILPDPDTVTAGNY
jgi:hypothetical protein